MFCMTHQKPGPKPKPLDQLADKTLRNRGLLRTRKLATETHCANDHPWAEETTGYRTNGDRFCRICFRNSSRKSQGKPPIPDDTPFGPKNAEKTHCPNNHEYTPENTYVKKTGWRRCRVCARDQRIRTQYHLEPEDFGRMLEEQDGGCAICHWTLEEGENLHVDHGHEDGRVRGLICNNCNNGIGRFEDSPELLRAAADYLERTKVLVRS